MLSKALGINEKIIAKAVERRTYGATPITQEIIDAQQKQADKYFEIGLIPKNLMYPKICLSNN
ncbi:hypothetical protein QKW52_24200 [Bacillus sonorensis]|nr:hypothetical protein [Bacillus sonorensis]